MNQSRPSAEAFRWHPGRVASTDSDDDLPTARRSTPSTQWRVVAVTASILIAVAVVVVVLAGGDSSDNDTAPTLVVNPPFPTAGTFVEADPRLPIVRADPDGVTIAAGAVFGLTPGRAIAPEEALAAVVPHLGQPDHDTGWIPLATEIRPCPELTDYRELWWGDLSLGFWGRGSATYFQYWTVGDRRFVSFLIPEIDVPTPTAPTMLGTEQDVRVGDTADDIPDAPNVTTSQRQGDDRFGDSTEVVLTAVSSADPDAPPAATDSLSRSGSYLSIDGDVVAFGAESFTC